MGWFWGLVGSGFIGAFGVTRGGEARGGEKDVCKHLLGVVPRPKIRFGVGLYEVTSGKMQMFSCLVCGSCSGKQGVRGVDTVERPALARSQRLEWLFCSGTC